MPANATRALPYLIKLHVRFPLSVRNLLVRPPTWITREWNSRREENVDPFLERCYANKNYKKFLDDSTLSVPTWCHKLIKSSNFSYFFLFWDFIKKDRNSIGS